MPIKRIQFPDGSIKRVEVPDGATDDQILQFVQSQSGQARPQESQQQKYQRLLAANEARNPSDPMHPSNNPTAGISGYDKFMAGMGKSVNDTGRGVGQLFGLSDEADIARDRQLDAPLMDTGAGFAGNVTGQALQMATPVPAGAALKATSWAGRAAPYVGAAARSGAFGGLQGVEGGESRLANAGQGAALGAAGQGIASASGALGRGAISRADKYTQQLAANAKQFGIKLGVPNISENPLVRTAVSQMERLPFSGAGSRARANQKALNKAIGTEIGVKNARRITPDVFDGAKQKIGQVFNDLSARNDVTLSTTHVADIKRVVDEATRLGGADLGKTVRAWADDLFSRVDANGSIPGKAYKSFDSKAGKTMAAGGEKALYLGELRDVVRNAMDSSISAADRAAWLLARKQWAAVKTIEPLVAKTSNGNISPSSLMGAVTNNAAAKTRMASGNGGNLGDLARVGSRFMKESPNSGTADRLLVNGAIGGSLYGAQHQGWIDPQTAMLAGGGLLANRGLLKLLNSRALAAGEGKTINGLSKLMQTAPRALPAAAGAQGITITGGRKGTPEDLARDEEIVRRFHERR